MLQQTVFGTVIDTETGVETKRYGANKPRVLVVQYPYLCETPEGIVKVWAQHERQAWAKCTRMYGACYNKPKLTR